MPLISGRCPYCGGNLKISVQAKGELTCPFCGSIYLKEEAVNITNITNNIINNINTDNVIFNEYDEQKELKKARALIGKDDHLAIQVYTDIFTNNPNCCEARYVRLLLKKWSKIPFEEYFDTPYYDDEVEEAKDAFFKMALENNDEEIKPILKRFFSVEELCYDMVYYYDYEDKEIEASSRVSYLYSPEEIKKGLLLVIDQCYYLVRTSEYGSMSVEELRKAEKLMIQYDNYYVCKKIPDINSAEKARLERYEKEKERQEKEKERQEKEKERQEKYKLIEERKEIIKVISIIALFLPVILGVFFCYKLGSFDEAETLKTLWAFHSVVSLFSAIFSLIYSSQEDDAGSIRIVAGFAIVSTIITIVLTVIAFAKYGSLI